MSGKTSNRFLPISICSPLHTLQRAFSLLLCNKEDTAVSCPVVHMLCANPVAHKGIAYIASLGSERTHQPQHTVVA
jgi:hypothetical protein